MKKLVLLAVILVLVSGCVQFPEEEQETSQADSIYEPAPAEPAAAPEPVVNATPEPNPLAPLPASTTSKPAVRPKAVVLNATNTTLPNKTQAPQGLSTDSYISMGEGETKYIYVKSPK
jgi:uncharacterized lipoprotein